MSIYHEHPERLIIEELKCEIEAIIGKIEAQYQHNQGLILSEDDIKCLIYQQLQGLFYWKRRGLGRPIACNQHNNQSYAWLKQLPNWRCPTFDNGIYASPVHAEVPWYDENNRLAIRPDITILQPQHLSIIHGLTGPKLPSKQFEFSGQGIIFEIKFCRYKAGISKNFFGRIQRDFDKIERLFARLSGQGANNSLFCYYVVFNKTDNRCQEFDDFLNENREGSNYKLEYCTGLVRFN